MSRSPSDYKQKCPVCGLPCVIGVSHGGGHYEIGCSCCGEYKVTDLAMSFLPDRKRSREQTAYASWFLLRNPGFTIDSKNMSFLDEIKGPDLAQRGINLLLELSTAYPRPGDTFRDSDLRVDSGILEQRTSDRLDIYSHRYFTVSELRPLKLLAVSASPDRKELDWLIKNYLFALGYMATPEPQRHNITLAGWKLVEEQLSPNKQSLDGFIAMSFQEKYLLLYDQALHPGISEAGYAPLRLDRHEHNNRIDDEIIACIRKSRFVVADFSMQRGGIYFEAGYALGLGLPVIWTVEQTALDEVHFDNRQYNFLVWEEGKYDDLARRLTHRIEATIGRPS